MPPRRRLLAWLYTGPFGHLAGGVADWVELMARYQLYRFRRKIGQDPGTPFSS
jgi:hypothetical protein